MGVKQQSERKDRDKQLEITPKEIEIIQEMDDDVNQNWIEKNISLERYENWCIHKSKKRYQESDNLKSSKEFLEIKVLITKNFEIEHWINLSEHKKRDRYEKLR